MSCISLRLTASIDREWFAPYPLESLHFNVTPIESKKNVDNFTRDRHGIAG